MSTMKIRNNSKRAFHHKDGVLKPESFGVVTITEGKKLLRLYPKEIVDLDTVFSNFEKASVEDVAQIEPVIIPGSQESKDKAKAAADAEIAEQAEADKIAAEKAAKEEKKNILAPKKAAE